jgi:hypothetical protein
MKINDGQRSKMAAMNVPRQILSGSADARSPELAKYMAAARQYLSPEKVAEFEAAYRRMKERAERWGSSSSHPAKTSSE